MIALIAAVLLSIPTPTPAPAANSSASPSASASPKATPKASPTPSSPYAAMKWREVGPAASGGRVAAVTGSASDPNLYYIGAAGGGVWKSTNGGQTWSPVFDDQDVQSIGAVTIGSSDNKVVWIGSGEANPRNDVMLGTGVFKSTDAGASWKKMGLSDLRSISRIVVDPKDPNHVVVGGLGDLFKDSAAGGVYVTTDGGKTWTHSLYVGPSSGASDLAMDPKNANVIFAGIWQFRRQPWTASSGGPDDGLYKSTDGGKAWTKLTGHGLPTGLSGRIAVDVSRSDPSRVYALIQSKEGFLFRSDDSGATWTMVNNDTLIDQRPFYFSHIAVDPTNKDRIISISMYPAISKDGGKTFKKIAGEIHPDYHSIWIAPDNPKRMILGQDGGAFLTVDGGSTWFFSRNYAIGQIYHIAADDKNPYNVCGGFQDNSGWCWPSNSRDDDGITNAYVTPVVGGDGQWLVPDPANPDQVWVDSQDGALQIWMGKSRQTYGIYPDLGGFNGFDYSKDKYRFNWDSPIAFAPWDPHTVWYGGNVVFQTHDEGRHWTAISPDLTLNDKSHQVISGGPINYDVSGAEGSDNILDIEGSTIARGEIWVGTDDGLVQLTRDGGKHWSNVTPKGLPPYGRVETIAPSTFVDGTAFVCFDRHYSGDYVPYVYKTTNFGKTWTSIASGLPKDQPVRTVRQDVVNPRLVYAGLERSIWISFDGASSWKSLQANLPRTAVFDLRFQRQFNDIVIATHGRSAWIMDDVRPLQEFEHAKAAGHYVFQPRTAYDYATTEKAEGIYTEYAAENPPAGAMIYFYQAKAGKKTPVVDIYDARGNRVRHVVGTHKAPDSDKRLPFVKNDPGINRFAWSLREDPITPWLGAANKADHEPGFGVPVVPGTYSARVTFSDGTRLSRSFVVKPDPDAPWTQADYEARHAYLKGILVELDALNRGLNSIDAQIRRLKKLGTPAALAAAQSGSAWEKSVSADYKNDEDGVLWPPKVREDVEGALFAVFGSQGPPLEPAYKAAAIVKQRYQKAAAQISSWLATARAIH
jgi:photosystem II stability/assembly factor-like uncharacterized protein